MPWHSIRDSGKGEPEVGIHMRRSIDPAAECIRYLTEKYCVQDPPDSVILQNCRDYARNYRIPQEKLEALTAPLLPLEAELDRVMAENRPLWEEMFYPGGEDNMLAWGLYMLDRQGGTETLSRERLRCRLLAFLLTRELDELTSLPDAAALMAFLNGLDCDIRTKWVCVQVWEDPMAYWRKYRRMAELAEAVFAPHRDALQPLADRALQWMGQRLEADSGLLWDELDMEQGTDEVVVVPLCLEFNGLGIVWDEAIPAGPAIQFVGILRPQVQALRESCGSRAEKMADQMKIVADKSRLEILMALRAAPLCGQELSRRVGLSAGTISHHMACLVREGFVTMSKRGNRVTYELRRGKLEEFLDTLRASLI